MYLSSCWLVLVISSRTTRSVLCIALPSVNIANPSCFLLTIWPHVLVEIQVGLGLVCLF